MFAYPFLCIIQHIQEGWFSLNQVENQEAKVGEVALQIGYKENNGTTGVCNKFLCNILEITKH